MSRKRLLHVLSLYLEFRYCYVNQFGYVLFIAYFRLYCIFLPLGE